MGKVRDVFGRSSGIKRSNLERSIIEDQLEESVSLEYKALGKESSLTEALVEKVLVGPIVSFLNGLQRQSSLLVLGIKAKDHVPTKVEPIPATVLNAQRIRQLMVRHIAGLPTFRSFPSFRVVQVSCGDEGLVYMVELDQWEDVLYYSRISDTAFARRGDETYRLSLPDVLGIINAKSRPHPQIGFTWKPRSDSAPQPNAGSVNVNTPPPAIGSVIEVRVENTGTRPAGHVLGTLAFTCEKPEGVTVEVKSGTFNDITYLNPGVLKIFNFQAGQSGGELVYPTLNLVIGELSITIPSEKQLNLSANTLDEEGLTLQTFTFDSVPDVKETSHTRKSWLG